MAVHRAYVQGKLGGSVSVQEVETPIPTSGQVLVKVLAAPLLSYAKAVLEGNLFPLIYPLVPGIAAIGRIELRGPDVSKLRSGDLVFCNPTVRARDDDCSAILQGWFAGTNEVARNLMETSWRNGSWAEYMLCPAENAVFLDDNRLIGDLQYAPADLVWINELLVPYGGWKRAGLRTGETVVVAPASGHFGRAAVRMALALGARKVLAVSRRRGDTTYAADEAERDRVEPVYLSGDLGEDAKRIKSASPGGKGADVYLDFSPPQATEATHPNSCILSLKPRGRAVLMGGVHRKLAIDYEWVMLHNLTISGNFMYDHELPRELVSMIEAGLVNLKTFETTVYPFPALQSGLDFAENSAGPDRLTVLEVQRDRK